MKRFFLLAIGLWCLAGPAIAQQTKSLSIPKNKYGLPVISTVDLYRQHVDRYPDHELVELATYIPGLVLDIKYATAGNLVHEPVYTLATAYARKPVADALKEIQAELKPMGLGLKVFDGYRPYRVTEIFYQKVKEKAYVANPRQGSRHNRGCAMDVTLIRLKDGKELEMPSAYDATVVQSHVDYMNISPEVKKNRALLINIMAKHGFKVHPKEWWHYDYKDWRNYPLMDFSFEELRKL